MESAPLSNDGVPEGDPGRACPAVWRCLLGAEAFAEGPVVVVVVVVVVIVVPVAVPAAG